MSNPQLLDCAVEIWLCTGYLLREAVWPASMQEALAGSLLAELPAGGVQLLAKDGSARLVLHALGHRVAVCYPLLLEANAEQQAFQYAWQTSLYSCNDLPPRWYPGLQLALAAQQLFRREGSAYDSSGAPQERVADEVDNIQTKVSELPTAVCANHSSRHSIAADGWWLDHSSTLLPPDEVVHFEWTPEATYQYIEVLQVIAMS